MGLTIFPPGSNRATRIFYVGVMIVLVAIISVLLSPFLPIGGPFGSIAAQREVSRGYFAYRIGMPNSGWKKEWKATLENTYGIHVKDGSAGCFRAPFSDTYEQAYNRIQLAAIRQAYGFDVIATTRELAYREWKAKSEAAPRPAGPRVGFSPALSEAEVAAVRTITPGLAFPPAVEPLTFSPRIGPTPPPEPLAIP